MIATIGTTNQSWVTEYQTKRFSTFTEDLHQLLDWLKSQSCTHKLLICIYHMLDKNEPFNDELYNMEAKPKLTYAPQIIEDMAIRFLETLGYQIPDKRIHA